MKFLRMTTLALLVFSASSVASANNAAATSNVVVDGDMCRQVISPQISKGLLNKLLNVLPQNDADSVLTVVKHSNAEKINKQRARNINTPVAISIYSAGQGSWTQLWDRAIEVAYGALENAIGDWYERAIDKAVNTVNRTTSHALNKVSSRLGKYAGPIVSASLSNIIPNVAEALGDCAKNLTAPCLEKVEQELNRSIGEGVDRGVSIAQRQVYNAGLEGVTKVYNKSYEVLYKVSPELAKESLDWYYDARSAVKVAVYGSTSDILSTDHVFSVLGLDPTVHIYGTRR